MTKDEMLKEIDRALQMLAQGRAQYPEFGPLEDVEDAVRTLRSEVTLRWPLSDVERARVEIGQFAVRNLDDVDHDLVMQLVRVGRLAKEGDGGGVLSPPQS